MFHRIFAHRGDESGFSTAELLGNAAMAIIALVAIWALVQGAGENLVGEMFNRLKG